jgi:basic amino acid/polyamine antiporter, APA family
MPVPPQPQYPHQPASMLRRALGAPLLFSVIYTSVASAIYFSLGVIADRALGLTPVVFLVVGLFFVLTTMTYVEGASLHQDRAGATVFARYAFNELWSFIAGWAVLLDFLILIAVTSLSATNYLSTFWGDAGSGVVELMIALGVILYVAVRNVMGFAVTRWKHIATLVTADFAVQLIIIVVGLAAALNIDVLTASIHLGATPTWQDLVFALTVGTVEFTGLESASGLAGEVAVGRRGLKRLVCSATGIVLVAYTGVALAAISVLPVVDGHTQLGSPGLIERPVVGVAEALHPHWLAVGLKYVVAALATVTLIAAANSAMLGLSRLAYSLATNRQIPSAIGRLHPTRSTPFIVIAIGAALAGALVVPGDLEFLVGIYAFGALLAFTIAHVSVARMRFTDPDSVRPYRIPLSIGLRGGSVPLPAVLGAVASGAGWVAVMILHDPARYVGLGWMLAGLAMYVVYRRADETSLLRRVTVAPEVLRADPPRERDYGSILVPLFGTSLDEDIVQTAALLVAGEPTDEAAIDAATIEAVWIFVIPMSLPLDARLPEAQVKEARQALARAKAVGEEYTGVQVATATVRTRRAGYAIVDEAKRRGVEAIVLGAEEPSLIRGGARLGGRGGPLENFVGDVTKYVIGKADCRVIVTAPASGESAAEHRSRLAPANP